MSYIARQHVEQTLSDQKVHWDSLTFYNAGDCSIFVVSDKAVEGRRFTVYSSCDGGYSLTQVAQVATRAKANRVVAEALDQANKAMRKLLDSALTRKAIEVLPEAMRELRYQEIRAEALRIFSVTYEMALNDGAWMDEEDLPRRQDLLEDSAHQNMVDALLEMGFEMSSLPLPYFTFADIDKNRYQVTEEARENPSWFLERSARKR